MFTKAIRLTALAFYYGVLRYLPANNIPGGGLLKLVRLIVVQAISPSVGRNVNIQRGVYFGSGTFLSIGANSGLGVNCRVHGPVHIGRDVLIGSDVVMHTRNHGHSSIEIPMRLQPYVNDRPIVIGDDVWLGDRVILLPGVNIGRGSIVGAGTVLAKSVPDYSIVVGNPGRVVRSRMLKD